MNKYYLVRKDYLMDNEVDLMDSKIMAKTVFASSRNAMSTKRKWTADEVARLREARGTSQYCGGWDKVVEHVSNGRTKTQCMNKWNDLRIADKCAALQQDDTDPAIAQNGTTNSRTGKWTPEEVTQLKALMESPPDRSKPRLHIAHAMFPHKSIVQVHLKLKNLKRFEIRLEQSTRLPMVREKLRRMVSSHGGVEKADWKTISEVVGETIYQCQRIYDDMLKLKYGKLNWKPDEVDRLVAATHSQQGNAGDYDWNVIANAMETRTKRQCYLKFYRLSRTKRDTAGQESYCVKIPT
ncbi:hypothetical protein EV179_004926 [Coemansia sp. RSA 487]|nr:hypothetical protein EV179_004926 [Coemansia sp. RSA 487]